MLKCFNKARMDATSELIFCRQFYKLSKDLRAKHVAQYAAANPNQSLEQQGGINGDAYEATTDRSMLRDIGVPDELIDVWTSPATMRDEEEEERQAITRQQRRRRVRLTHRPDPRRFTMAAQGRVDDLW